MNRTIPADRLLEFANFDSEEGVQLYTNPNISRFIYRPLAPGYAVTLGNALRRILLSSIPGCGIRSILIDGAEHQYSTIKGMSEDVVTFINNLKSIRFQFLSQITDRARLRLNINGPATVHANKIVLPEGILRIVLNEDAYICTLSADARLKCDIFVERGYGYVDSSFDIANLPYKHIAVGNILNAVKRVALQVNNTRYGEYTDYEQLEIEIETDGSLSPAEALQKAIDILMDHISDFHALLKTQPKISLAQSQPLGDRYLRPVSELPSLSIKTIEILHQNGIFTAGDLAEYTERELNKIPKFGARKIQDIKTALAGLHLHLKDASIVLDKEKD